MDFSNLEDLLGQMKDTYEDGINAMTDINDMVAEDMDPTHRIEIKINLEGNAEGHPYKVDASLVYLIDLATMIQASESPVGDLSSILGQIGVDIGGDADAVMEQLSQPRTVGTLHELTTNELIVYDENGKVDIGLNEKGTLLATLNENRLQLNFEGVFSYPQNPGLFIIVPSGQKMQEHIQFDMDDLDTPISYQWTDQDGLKVSGSAKINSL